MWVPPEDKDPILLLAKKLGADIVLNPRTEPISERIRLLTKSGEIAAVIETSGSDLGIRESIKSVRQGGRIIIGFPDKPIEIDLVNDVSMKESLITGIFGRRLFETWIQAEQLLESGRLNISPIITNRYPLSEFKDAFNIASSRNYGKVIFKCYN